MINVLMWLLRLPFRLLSRVYRFLRTFWQFASIFIIVLLIGLNVATLSFDVANRMLSSVIDAVAGNVSLRSKTEAELDGTRRRLAELEADIDRKQARIADLDAKMARQSNDLADVSAERTRLMEELNTVTVDLGAERERQAALSDRLRTAEADLNEERGLRRQDAMEIETERARRFSMIDDLDNRTQRVVTRSRNTLAREVSSMPLEAVPWLGIITIVGITTLEARDLCETAKDMQAIRTSLGISNPLATGTNEICGVEMPSVEELWALTISGKDAGMVVRCRNIKESGRPIPEECPDISNLPLPPEAGSTESTDPGPLQRIEDVGQSMDTQTHPGPLTIQE